VHETLRPALDAGAHKGAVPWPRALRVHQIGANYSMENRLILIRSQSRYDPGEGMAFSTPWAEPPIRRRAQPQVSFHLRVDAPFCQHQAASHLAPPAVWSRKVGRTA